MSYACSGPVLTLLPMNGLRERRRAIVELDVLDVLALVFVAFVMIAIAVVYLAQ